jgi:exosortase A-associated hydrolase 2
MEAFYLKGATARLFCILHRPATDSPPKGAVVYLAPFAEEMNKSRRMAALQARALADAGWWVMQPDLTGCGDSEGEYSDASWDLWCDDAARSLDWLQAASGMQPALWGLRAGCLLASAVARARPAACRLVFWQPVASGKQHLQQFLRLKVAGAMFAEGKQGGDGTRQLREQLQAGEAVEVAGYLLAPALALGLDAATLTAPQASGKVSWIELSSATEPELSIPSRQAIEKWSAAGWQVDSQVLPGPGFWQTQEIEEVPVLLDATLCAMVVAAG